MFLGDIVTTKSMLPIMEMLQAFSGRHFQNGRHRNYIFGYNSVSRIDRHDFGV